VRETGDQPRESASDGDDNAVVAGQNQVWEARMTPVTYRIETATAADLHLIEEWTSWKSGRDLPCIVGGERPLEVFRTGRLRVLSAWAGDERVGISLLAASADIAIQVWRMRIEPAIPAGECLLWLGLAIHPIYRRSGIGPELVRRTIGMATTTGYPFIAAVFPIQDPRASVLLLRAGFVKLGESECEASARPYCVYLCSTPGLSIGTTADVELAS
jgi:GNAT superfamily N-acetyltransferase